MLFCAETISTPGQQHIQISEIIKGSIEKIRSHPRVGPDVPIIVAIEACSSEATFMAPMFEQVDTNLIAMREFKQDGNYGVPKNKNVLIGLIGTTQALLTRNLIHIPSDSISFNSTFSTTHPTIRDHREVLMKQFGNFRMDQYTRQIHGKSGGNNDDMIIAFMMSLYWMTRFCVRNIPIYMEFRSRFRADIWLSAMAPYLSIYSEKD